MASKSKRRRRVFRASCILAALIIAGSSFAWFTSKDEVTNRLTATADYGVSIVEDFTPPKKMTPGQTVNKDLSVVNTGSVDSVVRLSLDNKINATRLTSEPLTTTIQSGKTWTVTDTGVKQELSTAGAVNTTNDTYTAPTIPEGQTRVYDILDFNTTPTTMAYNKTYVELSPFEKTNADGTKEANEVTTLMAGGQVVVAGGKSVAPEDQIVRSGDDINGGFAVIYTADDNKYYMLGDGSNSTTAGKYYEVTKSNDTNGVYSVRATGEQTNKPAGLKVAALARDYSGTGEYVPQDAGLYLFKRSAGITDSGSASGVDENTSLTYSGFYYDAAGKFLSLYNEQADNTGDKNTAKADGITVTYTDGVVSKIENVKLAVKEIDLTNDDGKWTVTFLSAAKGLGSPTAAVADVLANEADKSDAKYLKAVYHVTADQDNGVANNDKDIVYYIKLDDDWFKNWQFIVDNSASNKKDGTSNDGLGYFYYRKVLDSGETSPKLIDSVTLSGDMTSKNFLDMTYDLNVMLDTAQVTKDENDKETLASITGWTNVTATLKKDAATTDHPVTDSTISGDGVDGTIDWITWATT